MSYASVVAQNVSPSTELPQPDPNLLEGQRGTDGTSTKIGTDLEGDNHNNRAEKDVLDRKKRGTSNEGDRTLSKKKKDDHHDKSITKNERFLKPLNDLAGDDDSWRGKIIQRKTLMTVFNLVTITGLSFLAFKNWDKPRWDKRIISGIALGLGGLLGTQGYLGLSSTSDDKAKK